MKISKYIKIFAGFAAFYLVFVSVAIGLFIKAEAKYWPFFIEHGYDPYAKMICYIIILGGIIGAGTVFVTLNGIAQLVSGSVRKAAESGVSDSEKETEDEEADSADEIPEKTETSKRKKTWTCTVCGAENPNSVEVCQNCIKKVGKG